MKSAYIFIWFLILALSSPAQWTKIDEITSPLVYSALFSGDNIFVGGDSLYISRDKGLTWEAKSLTGGTIEVTSLFASDDKIFAGTYGAGIYQSTNNGESWEPFNNGISGFAVYAEDFEKSGDTIYYGSDGGGVYFIKLNSDVWQSYNQNLPSSVAWTVNDLAISNTNLILSSGASGFHHIRPKGADQWTEMTIKTPAGININSNSLLAFGDTVFSGSNWGIYRSTDNGLNWDSVGITALHVPAVAFAKDGNRIYTGFTRASGNDFFIWYSDDFGTSWNVLDHQFQFLHKLYVYDNKIWAATNDGFWFTELTPTSAEPISQIKSFNLQQNYPNPFNPKTTIRYSVGSNQNITLKIYDLLGNEVSVLVNEPKSAGDYEVEFKSDILPSGVYFYRLHSPADNLVITKKMVLLK